MRSRGFSLVEMVLVTAVVSIVSTIAVLGFTDYYRRYRTEAQTRLIYSQLQKARVDAICQRRATLVKLFPGRFEVYSSPQDDSCGVKPLQTYALSYPVTLKEGDDAVLQFPVGFEKQGTATNSGSICLETSAGSGAVDSIVVSATRINIGKKKDQDDDCTSANIIIR